MKRSFSLARRSPLPLVAAGTALIAGTYGLIRLAFGLFLPDVQAELRLGVTEAGLAAGGASVVYCAGALLGFLAATRHARALVVAAALSAGAGAFGMATAPDAGSFTVFVIASSAGAGLASPALVAVLRSSPLTRGRPRAQAVVNAGTGPGLVAAGGLALILLPDWRTAWAIAAVVTLMAGAAVLVLGAAAEDGERSGLRRHPRASGAGDALPSRPALPPASWFRAQRRPLVAALLMGVGSAAVWTYGRTFLVESGADEIGSTVAWIALGLGGSAVLGTAGWLERRGPRVSWLITAGAVALASLALAPAAGTPPLALAVCGAFGWGYVAASGALIAWTAQLDPERAAAGTALLFITLILGQALGAAAFGALLPAAGQGVVLVVAAAASAAAAVPALPVPPRSRVTATPSLHP